MKVGDKIILRTSWMSSRDKTHHVIRNFTKQGKIRLDNGMLFNCEGKRLERGWGIMWLEEVE